MKTIAILTFWFLASAFAAPVTLAQGTGSPVQQKVSPEALIEGTLIVIRIVALKDTAPSANEFNGPDKGNKFLSIQIIVDNTKGREEWEVEPRNFKLKDAEGNVYEIESLSEVAQPTLKSGKVDAGDLVKGWITFQVGEGVNIKTMKLRHEDSVLSETAAKSAWIPLSSVPK
jgi:hypothetical protein